MLNDHNNENYFKTNYFLKVMRFLNLLEPDRNIISISKVFMWTMLFIICFVLVVMPDQLEVIIGASSALIASLLNYSYRRWTQVNNIVYNRDEDTELEDCDPYGGGSSGYGSGKSKKKTEEYDVLSKADD